MKKRKHQRGTQLHTKQREKIIYNKKQTKKIRNECFHKVSSSLNNVGERYIFQSEQKLVCYNNFWKL